MINTYTQFPATGGGGGGGGGGGSGIQAPNQVHTTISNGGVVGFTIEALGINFNEAFNNGIGPQIVSALGGNQTTNGSMAITNLTNPSLNNGDFNIKLTHSMAASAFNSLYGTGFNGAGGSTFFDEVFFLVGWYLESPSGTATISSGDINITGVSGNINGTSANAKTSRSQVGQNYPLIDSTSFTNAAETFDFTGFGGVTNDSHLGSNGVVTAGNTSVFVQGDSHCIVSLGNLSGRSGGNPTGSSGQSFNIAFSIVANISGSQERTLFMYELLLT